MLEYTYVKNTNNIDNSIEPKIVNTSFDLKLWDKTTFHNVFDVKVGEKLRGNVLKISLYDSTYNNQTLHNNWNISTFPVYDGFMNGKN
jgi:hypothetical protein